MLVVTVGVALTLRMASTSALPPPADGPAVLVGAGDIAECDSEADEATAALLDDIPGTVFTTGDNAYPRGLHENFADCYEPSWGRHKDRTRPAPGNHDFGERRGAGYYRYFGAAAGEPGKGYYSYELGGWHVVVLNSECHRVGCEPGSEQEVWLREDLAAHPAQCTVAIWHNPRFSSGRYGDDDAYQPFWDALYEHGAEVVVNGHEHLYERFVPQAPDGTPDPDRGLRQFTVGTGGGNLRGFESIQEGSEARGEAHGVLKLTLHAGSYDWEFVSVEDGAFTDAGSGTCH